MASEADPVVYYVVDSSSRERRERKGARTSQGKDRSSKATSKRQGFMVTMHFGSNTNLAGGNSGEDRVDPSTRPVFLGAV